MKRIKQIHILFLISGLVFLIAGILMNDSTLDISIHDTYIIIAYLHIGILFFLIYALFAFVYFFIRKHQNYLLGILHLLSGLPLFIHIMFASQFFMGSPQRYYTMSEPDTIFSTVFNESVYVVIILFVIAQLLFLINIIYSILKALKQRPGN